MKPLKAFSSPKKVTQTFNKPSLTDQQFKQDCDIGYIIESYAHLGQNITTEGLQYGDVSTYKDYQDALYTVAQYKTAFEQLPSSERDKFKTVDNFVEYITDSSNLKESVEKGYIDSNTIDINDIYPEPQKFNTGVELSASVQGAEVPPVDTSAPSSQEG